MKQKERVFRMKEFEVSHRLSAMKIGVDAVLLGAWMQLPQSGLALDAGCGCGILSLMAAQGSSRLRIEAVDIDPLAVIEAKMNFERSKWSERLCCYRADATRLRGKYDAIFSNPPYFDSGIEHPESWRMRARHADSLSPVSILSLAGNLLSPEGNVSLICPPSWLPSLRKNSPGLYLQKITEISGRRDKTPTRMLSQWGFQNKPIIYSKLAIEEGPGIFTEEYVGLTQAFYLNLKKS